MKTTLLKLMLFLAISLVANSSKSQTVQNTEDYPFTRVSLQKDTLFILDCPVGKHLMDIWRDDKKPSHPTPVLIFTKDVDFIQKKKVKCEKIVETVKLN